MGLFKKRTKNGMTRDMVQPQKKARAPRQRTPLTKRVGGALSGVGNAFVRLTDDVETCFAIGLVTALFSSFFNEGVLCLLPEAARQYVLYLLLVVEGFVLLVAFYLMLRHRLRVVMASVVIGGILFYTLIARNRYLFYDLRDSIASVCLPVFALALSIHDQRKLWDVLTSCAQTVIAVGVAYAAIVLFPTGESDNAWFGYNMVIPMMAILSADRGTRKGLSLVLDVILLALGFVCVALFSTPETVFVLFVYGLCLYWRHSVRLSDTAAGLVSRGKKRSVLEYKGRYYAKRGLSVFLVAAIAVVAAFVMYRPAMGAAYESLKQAGVDVPVLESIAVRDNVVEGVSVDDMRLETLKLIVTRPIFGYGIGMDRAVLGGRALKVTAETVPQMYPRNFFLEVWLQFGLIMGILLVLALATACYYALAVCSDRPYEYNLLLMLTVYCSIFLMFNGSYLTTPAFWMLIALCMRYCIRFVFEYAAHYVKQQSAAARHAALEEE